MGKYKKDVGVARLISQVMLRDRILQAEKLQKPVFPYVAEQLHEFTDIAMHRKISYDILWYIGQYCDLFPEETEIYDFHNGREIQLTADIFPIAVQVYNHFLETYADTPDETT